MEFIDDLKKRLQEKLPEDRAHSLLMNYKRQSVDEILSSKIDVKLSAVLCLMFIEDGKWKVYLMERNSYNGVHSAQISFPGGRKEDIDVDFRETALREAQEELNINPSDVEILGELSSLYIPPSNFIVYPFLGVATNEQNIKPDPVEVYQVLKAELADLMKEGAIKESSVEMSGSSARIKVKHFSVENHIVWGATGMILAELVYILKEIGVRLDS